MTERPIYCLHNLEKTYSGRLVLSLEELLVTNGEILGLVGPSGAGKSTLLRLLNFLETPTRGSFEFMGVEYTGGQAVPLEGRRQVTCVFQHPILLNRSVWDNVAFGLRLRGQREANREVEAVLEQVGLRDFARQPARQLSGGESQRVALARALVLRPEVLLLDEPTANLDPYNVGLIEQIVRQENGERGTTVILVTHNVFQARRLADRTALLLNGKLVEIAETEPFFTSPADARTHAFVNGEMVY